jgi:hypothetical protein
MVILLEYDSEETESTKAVEKLIADFRAGETLFFVAAPDIPESEIAECLVVSAGIGGVVSVE